MFIFKFCLVVYFVIFLFFMENNLERFIFGEKFFINILIFMFFFLVLFGLFFSGLVRLFFSAFRVFIRWCCWKGIFRLLYVFFNIILIWVVVKFFLVLLVGGVFVIDYLGGGMGVLLFMLSFIMVRSFLFRVSLFNFMILFCLVVNVSNVYVGCMVEMFNNSEIVIVFFVLFVLFIILIWVNIFWVCVVVLWMVYLLLRYMYIIFLK